MKNSPPLVRLDYASRSNVVDVDVSYKSDGGKSNEAITRRAVHVVGYLWGCFMGTTTPREALAVSRCVFVLSALGCHRHVGEARHPLRGELLNC